MQRSDQPAGERNHELNDRIAPGHPDRMDPYTQDQQANQQRTENVKQKPGDIDQQHAGLTMEVKRSGF
jgi:hypothetical protein